jgi:tRNA(adenine34) deaminase
MFSEEIVRALLVQTVDVAQKAFDLGNYPIGTVIADGAGSILATEMNEYATSDDITAHAEILALRKLGRRLDNDSPGEYYLFSSLEPCYGCSFFISRTNIRHIYSALKDPYKGGIGDLAGRPEFAPFFAGLEFVNEPFADLASRSRHLLREYFLKQGKTKAASFYA